MVNGIKCYDCSLFDVCKAYAKLKPFTDEAKVDLGVEISFNNCKHYIPEDSEDLGDIAEDEE